MTTEPAIPDSPTPPTPGEEPDSYFIRVGKTRYRPTAHTGGAWRKTEQHVSPLAGLIVHALDRFVVERHGAEQAAGLVLARLTVEILGVAAIHELDIHVEIVRPGRTIELLEAVVTVADRPVARARAWRLARHDTAAVSGGQPDPLPPPDGLTSWPLGSIWPGGYIASLDVRPVTEPRPGRTTAWVSSPLDLVADEPVSALARYITLVDTANGIAVRRSPKTWMFPNVDLTIHLHRQPTGHWVGLDTTVIFGPEGQGLTSTVLHDLNGPIGRAEQILTIRPLT